MSAPGFRAPDCVAGCGSGSGLNGAGGDRSLPDTLARDPPRSGEETHGGRSAPRLVRFADRTTREERYRCKSGVREGLHGLVREPWALTGMEEDRCRGGPGDKIGGRYVRSSRLLRLL